MLSRSRNRRRRADRSPGVLRRTSPSEIAERRTQEQQERGDSYIRWRILSALIVLVFGAMLVFIFTTDLFYVRSVRVRGLGYLTTEEVFGFADVANYHLFWLDPDVVRDSILRSSSIADARVELAWPPHMINIEIEERQPAIIWSEAGQRLWVDLQGRMMPARVETNNLIRVEVTAGAFDETLTDGQQLDKDIVFGALQLQELLPQNSFLNYDRVHGLGWTDENGWQVWMGAGTGMTDKLKIYQTLVQDLITRGIQPGEINIANPNAPFYTVLWGR